MRMTTAMSRRTPFTSVPVAIRYATIAASPAMTEFAGRVILKNPARPIRRIRYRAVLILTCVPR